MTMSDKKLGTSNEFFITKWMRKNNLDRKSTNPLETALTGGAQSPHKELTTNYYRLTTSNDNSARSAHKGRLTPHTSPLTHIAFTMAEILLSLTIIGVVAAITLPSLTGNINERTWNTQRKALYSRISQAISLMPALNGFGTLNATTDTAAETFITSGLAKVLKINNICDNEHLQDCGIVPEFTNMATTKMSTPTTLHSLNGWFSHVEYLESSYETNNTKAVAFETQNGESIIAYYNRTCRTEYLSESGQTAHGNSYGFPEATMCVNFIYDLNGSKGPNTFGKDIGIITVFNATDSIVVAPMPSSTVNANNGEQIGLNDALGACKQQDPESRLPNIDEISSMLINKNITNLAAAAGMWSNSRFNAQRIWTISPNTGGRHTGSTEDIYYVRCIKR